MPLSDDLVDRVAATTPLDRAQAARVVEDVISYFDETAEAFVSRRHRELKQRGLKNDAIFERISAELVERPVAPPTLSLRQLRRIVYG